MVNLGKECNEHQKNVILLGSANAKYHPMEGIDIRLTELLNPMKVYATNHTGVLNNLQLRDCSFVILYLEFDLPPLSDSETAALLTYVAEGGNLFVLHNGISVQSRSELCQLIGAKFTGHPPYQELPQIAYRIEQPSHPIFEGVSDFTLYDEAYQFEMDPFANRELLLSYDFEGKNFPAAWTRNYGKGRMVYFCCGHNKECFDNKQFSRVLTNVAAWLTKREEGK